MHCLICKQRAGLVKKSRRMPLVWKCGSCGFEWVDRKALAGHFSPPDYDAYPYNAHIDKWFEKMKPVYRAGLDARVSRTVGKAGLNQKSFLDIGCANGEYLRTAKDLGFGIVAGIEIDEHAVLRAQQFGRVWQSHDGVQGQFDIVQIKNVLSNIIDFKAFLKRSLDCLKPGGYLYLDILNENSLTALVRKTAMDQRQFGKDNARFGHLRPPYVINGFTLEAVRKMLAQTGLCIAHEQTTYCGSAQVPYSSTMITKVAGIAGTLIGKGPMLIVEARKNI